MVNTPSKWSATTFIGVIVTLITVILQALGVTEFSSEGITTLVMFVLGLAGIGGGVKVGKKVTEKSYRKIENYSGDGWYSTNLTKSASKGAILEQGTKDLIISTDKVRSYFTAKLQDSDGKIIQVGQSTAGKPIVLLMKDSKGNLLSEGKYTLTVTGDYGSSDSVSVTDRFEIA